jgi:hypothetical protein
MLPLRADELNGLNLIFIVLYPTLKAKARQYATTPHVSSFVEFGSARMMVFVDSSRRKCARNLEKEMKPMKRIVSAMMFAAGRLAVAPLVKAQDCRYMSNFDLRGSCGAGNWRFCRISSFTRKLLASFVLVEI